MKSLIAMFCIVAVVLSAGCTKSEIREKTSNSTSLNGSWELRQAQTSMTPTHDYSPGNGTILKFTDSTYERYTTGTLVESGNYFLMRDTTVEAEVGLIIPSGQFTNIIVFDSVSSRKTFFKISDNRLTLLSGYFPLDAGSQESYERLTNNR